MSYSDWIVFGLVQAAMVATAFWEAYIEGPEGWAENQVGWSIKIGSFTYTAYHFWLYWVMIPLLLAIPFAIIGWDAHLFWVLVFAYLVGTTVEDFMWFVVNPVYPFSKFNAQGTPWHQWVSIGKIQIPIFYIVRIIGALVVYGIVLI